MASDDQLQMRLERLLRPLGFVFLAYFAVCTLAIFSHASINYSRGLLAVAWSSAAFCVGTLIGFLFGFPKVVQDDSANAQAGQNGLYKLLINTNFAEVSDWLTKIIIGLGLVHIRRIWEGTLKLSQIISSNVAGGDREVGFALALLIAFSAGGVLFGYLYTRLYLTLVFSNFDRAVLLTDVSAKIDEVKTETTKQIQEVKNQTNAAERTLEAVTGLVVDKVISTAQLPDAQRDPESLELLAAASIPSSENETPSALKLYVRAFAAFSRGEYQEAINLGEQALTLDLPPKRRWAVLNTIGLAHHFLQPPAWKPGDPLDWFEKSKAAYERAIAASVSPSETLLTRANMAFLFLDAADFAAAETTATEILEHEKDPALSDLQLFDLARIALASAAVAQGKNDLAVATLNAVKRPQNWEYLFANKDIPDEIVVKLKALPQLKAAIAAFLAAFPKN